MEGSSAGSGNSGSSQNSSAGSVEFLLKDCYHGVRARLLTSNMERNPFRRFQKCPVTKIDNDLPPFQKECVRNMMRMNRSLDEQVKYKTMVVNLLTEGMRMEVEETGNPDRDAHDETRVVADRETIIAMRRTV
ncbi:zinc knuckle family protein [Perilla frutescens var. hirtella]|nr:zinc knuckle family protein [Perilla frutescens var. hirtella]